MLARTETLAEAEAALKGHTATIEATAEVFPLRPGFPKVVEQATIDGFDGEGAFAVVAGACVGEAAPVHRTAARALFPESELLTVTWDQDGPSCPDLGEAPGEGRGASRPKLGKDGRLSVVAFPLTYTEDGGEFEEQSWVAVALLRDEAGQLVASETFRNTTEFSSLGMVANQSGRVSLEERWAEGVCYGADQFRIGKGKVVVRAVGEKIQIERTTTEERDYTCPEGPETGQDDALGPRG